ncbi:MAG TPA: hypothetical protein VEI02_13790 [Planctomycetota bacterium]|nr:hypothetical protein [Planctomycetota bacterium]
MMRLPAAWTVCAALACASVANAQGLAFSVASDVASTNGGFVLQEELHRLDAGVRRAAVALEFMNLLVGDADGDGLLDDAPSDVDAVHWTGLTGPASFLWSTTANFNAPGGLTVLDGDVFQFTDVGVQVIFPEAFFQAATGTTTIDVDAFAVAPDGTTYFSFADDETTTSASLAAQNGGATLDEQCVFRIDPGQTFAMLHFTPAQVVGMFNTAYGASATTVVDVQGLELDPFHPGDLLLTSASAATAFKGKVVSSFGGGTPFVLGGTEIAPAAFDFPATSLDALCLVGSAPPPTLRAPQFLPSSATSAPVTLVATGFAPFETVQFAFTDAKMPRATFLEPTGTLGYGWSPLDPLSPMFAASLTHPQLTKTADAFGTASFAFSPAGVPSFVDAAVQVVGLGSFALSTPAGISFTP